MLNLDIIIEAVRENNFKSKQQLADFLNTSKLELNSALDAFNLPNTISKLKYMIQLQDYGIPLEKDWLVKQYVQSSRSLLDLEKELGVPPRFLEKLCKYHNISKRYKYSFNKDKLYNLNDPNVWYLAGLIATDGCIDKFANRISIGLVGDSEKSLLQDISNYFEDSHGVSIIYKLDKSGEKNYKVYNICFSDKNIKSFFRDNFNIYRTEESSKTFSLGFPKFFPNDECKKAYVLGCFDGDGCITHLNRNNPSAGLLTASKDFVLGLSNLLESSLDINTNFSEAHYFSISIGVSDGLEKFLDWMYSYNGFRLDRKYKKYIKVKDIVCSTVNTK